MCKTKDIKLILLFLNLIIVIFISIFFIQLKFNSHKKQNNDLLLKKTNIIPVIDLYKENIAKASLYNNYKENNWRIKILKINLDAPILEGTDSNILKKAVGHFKSTGKTSGNVCLAAHNRGYKYNYFQNIKDLKIGDEIIYIINEKQLKFAVDSNKIIKETDISVLENSKENKLTLITCEENKREYRRCIIAKQIL